MFESYRNAKADWFPQKEKELPSFYEEKLLEEAEARLETEEHLKPYIKEVTTLTRPFIFGKVLRWR